MTRLKVYIGMAIIVLVNTVVFGLLFTNQSQALPSGIQGFNSDSAEAKFINHMYGDFALNLEKPMDLMKTNEFMYVSDTNNNRVQVFDLAGEFLFTFGEEGSEPGQFHFPYGIAGDNKGQVYVADMYNGVISIHNAKGEFIDYFAQELTKNDVISSPAGLRIIKDLVYVTDIQTSRVFVLDLEGNLLLTIGEQGEDFGQFIAPNAVTADAEGNIYVVDTGNQRVQVFDAAGNFISTFNGYPVGTGESLFVNPRGIGIDSKGTIFVVSNLTHIVHRFDKEGNHLSQFGGMGDGPGDLYLPNGLFIDEKDTIYVTDTLNQRISIFK
ncbi:6-bladed beta-propeller [Anaerobacillus alkaliphilus]|uniref:6-bladed beta-propeller n=1 Tax=Anaerobacillus alkaliphilus TaxID=1548597 RepID=A0A4Q0VW18_9BACI|nr:6-bladed beta-propeller [Anaerobacillus alkaliphilus]RXJ01680.1 6-bladed beta-propeller [Anaerobacillus alkaliphilus]